MESLRKAQSRLSEQMKGLDTGAAKYQLSSFVAKVKGHSPSLQRSKVRTEKFHTLDVDILNTVKVRILNQKRREIFAAVLGETVPPNTEFSVQRTEDVMIVQYINFAKLTITHSQLEGCHRFDVEWHLVEGVQGQLQDSINLANAYWFGASLNAQQTWPMSHKHKLAPFVSSDCRYDPDNAYGSALERYWVSSTGAAIYVDSEVPLFVAVNEDEKEQLTLMSKFEKPFRNPFEYKLFLKYSIYQSSNIKVSHDLVRDEYFLKSEALPHEDLFRKVLWSTTAYIGSDLAEERLQQYVTNIIDNGFEPGLVELGDDWTPTYGDMQFDLKRFPECKEMITSIKDKGFQIMAWVHPFASPRSKAFYDGVNLWVKSSVVEGVTAWEHGPAKLLDFTNPDSRMWFKKKLIDLKEETGIDCFMFDGGQVNYLPPLFNTFDPISNPNSFSRRYVEFAYDLDCQDRFSMIRSGVGTQNVPLMLGMHAKDTSWGWDNGLATVIPSILTLGIMGYRFVMPGIVGGSTPRREAGGEIYIRWVEAVILMPAVKLSVPPWEYDDKTVKIVRKLFELRQKNMDYILKVAADAQSTGSPMVRPLWWMAPTDSIAVTIDSQFMLGDDLLVAPVLEKGSTNRSIYLPAGVWRDELRGTTVPGKKWLYSYRARLDELPHFRLLKEETNGEAEDKK